MGRAEVLTKALKSHDRMLYVEKNKEGKLCVFRHSIRWETYYLEDNVLLRFARPAPHFVLALTHNFKANGMDVDWGVEPIMHRIRSIDLWNRDLCREQEEQYEKKKAGLDRESRNQAEAFASDVRPIFKKTFADYNTSSMKKTDRRRKDEEKYGNQ